MIIDTIELTHLNKATLMITDKKDIIIWCTHDRDFKNGSYYLITKEQNIFYVVEKDTEVKDFKLNKE